MKQVIVKTFDNGISAHIFRAKLESEGITCVIQDENIVTLIPLYNNAVGGVKLKVYEQDVQKALEIIEEVEKTHLTDEQDKVIQCPNCSSRELYSDFKSMKGIKGFLSAITSFILVVFPIYYKSVYRCKECNTEFKAK